MARAAISRPKILNRTILIIVAAAALLMLAGIMLGRQNRPQALALDLGAHRAVSAIMGMSLNGRVVIDLSQKGRRESGGIDYLPGQGDALDFAVVWYDIFMDQGHQLAFRLHTSDLSVIGASGLVDLRITLGPGADVTATTTNADAARLIRERRGAELGTVANELDIVLAEFCALPLDPLTPAWAAMKAEATRYEGSEQRALNDKGRAQYLAKHGPVIPRCAEVGD